MAVTSHAAGKTRNQNKQHLTMASLVEVKILDYVLLLSCEESATVAEITASAVAEVQTFNLRNFP
jgi:hypothetical protein